MWQLFLTCFAHTHARTRIQYAWVRAQTRTLTQTQAHSDAPSQYHAWDYSGTSNPVWTAHFPGCLEGFLSDNTPSTSTRVAVPSRPPGSVPGGHGEDLASMEANHSQYKIHNMCNWLLIVAVSEHFTLTQIYLSLYLIKWSPHTTAFQIRYII